MDAGLAAGKKPKKPTRNLPDIDVSQVGQIGLAQELNFFSTTGVSNTAIDYGLPDGWDIGLGLFNAQFYSLSSNNSAFQPDVLFSLEKHWLVLSGQLIIGTQSGIGITSATTNFLSFSYLEFQQHFAQWNIDADVGGYYANAAIAGFNSGGFHLNLELPVVAKLRLNSDYLSGSNALGATTIKLLYPIANDWQLGFGVQIPNVYAGDRFIGLLGLYWH
jgi:hypothetical protein